MRTLTILAVTVFTVACVQKNLSQQQTSIPTAIQKKIDAIKEGAVQNPPTVVYSYDYNGEKVYYFSAPCCDRYSDLLNAKGEMICHPDGGFTGKGDGKCADFGVQRTNEVLIWKDERGK